MRFENVLCPLHTGSTACCYRFYSITGLIKDIYRCILSYSSKQDMIASVYAEIISKYIVENGDVKERTSRHYGAYMAFYREYLTAKSSIGLRPVTRHRNAVIETNIFPATFIRPLVHELSGEYINEVTGTLSVKPGSLAHRCIKILSWEEVLYESFSYKMDHLGNMVGRTFPRVTFSTNCMTAEKQVKTMAGFSKDTARRGAAFVHLRKLLPNALNFFHKALDCDKYVGTHLLKWNPKDVVKWVKMNTSAGIALMTTGKVKYKGVDIIVHDTGKKVFMLEAAIKQVHGFIMSVILGDPKYFTDLEIIRQKQEWRKATSLIEKDLEALQLKMREFFCPSLGLVILSHWFFRFS